MSQHCIMGVVQMYTVLKCLIHFEVFFTVIRVVPQKLISSHKYIFTIDSGRE